MERKSLFPALVTAAVGVAVAAAVVAVLVAAPGTREAPPAPGAAVLSDMKMRLLTREQMVGSRQVLLSPVAPEAVRMPPGAGDGKLWYGVLRVDQGGKRPLPFVLVETPRPAAPDAAWTWKLFADADLDGDLADERPIEAGAEPTQDSAGNGRKAAFEKVDTIRPGGGFHFFCFDFIVTDDWAAAAVRSAAALVGKAEVFGLRREVILFDANVNMLFADFQTSAHVLADAIRISPAPSNRPEDAGAMPLTPRLIFGDSALSVGLSDEAGGLAFEEVDPAPGQIAWPGQRPGDKVTVQMFSMLYGSLMRAPGEPVPSGDYNLLAYEVRRPGADGAEWALAGGWRGPVPRARVEPDRSTPLEFGPPLEARAWFMKGEAGKDPAGTVFIAMLRGAGGEHAEAAAPAEAGGAPARRAFGGFRIARAGDAPGAEPLYSGRFEFSGTGLVQGWLARWSPPGGIAEGEKLVMEASGDLGPFADGFDGRVEFESGRHTPIRLVVAGIERSSQAEAVGVEVGDKILRYDGNAIDGWRDLVLALRGAAGKTEVEFAVLRDGAERTFAVKPGRLGVVTLPLMPER